MRSIIYLLIAAMVVQTGLSQTANKANAKPGQPPVTSTKPLPGLQDSLDYAIGVTIGKWIVTNGFQVNSGNLFLRGLNDQLQKKPLLVNDSLISPLVSSYQRFIQTQKSSQQEAELFNSLKDKPGVGMFPNGVRYIIQKNGTGAHPTEKDSILVNIQAKLPDGTVVEDTYQSKKPFRATVSSFFPGLNETLLQMQEGSRWQLFVPSALAYADKGTAMIPPGSALVLDVELLSVKSNKQ